LCPPSGRAFLEHDVIPKQLHGAAVLRRAAEVDSQSDDIPPGDGTPISGVYATPGKGGNAQSKLREAARRGHGYLQRAVDGRGIQSVVGLDADFDLLIEPRDLRGFVHDHDGEDLGFDAGDEAFSSMIALKVLGDRLTAPALSRIVALVRRQSRRGRYRFFCEENGFAADTHCTAVAAAALYEDGWLTPEALRASGEQILAAAAPADVPASENLDPVTGRTEGDLHAGVVMVYWEDGQEPGAGPRGRKHDAAVAANALYALELAAAEAALEDRRGVIAATRAYVSDHLRRGRYLRGTRYQPSPDSFLYYASCLCRRFPAYRADLEGDLQRALEVRADATLRESAPDDPAGLLNQAMRAIAASNVGLAPDVEDLLLSQGRDGSWPAAPFCSLGKRPVYLGSSELTTMFAVKALEASLAHLRTRGSATTRAAARVA
jgi:hypothetical protein